MKKLRSVYVGSGYPVTVGAESENGADEFKIYGGSGVSFAPLKTPPGGEIRLYFRSEDPIRISEAVVSFDEYGKYVP